MYLFARRSYSIGGTSLTHYSHFIDYCLSLKSSQVVGIVHAQLVKVGFNRHTFLGNRCLDLYSRFGSVYDALKVFEDISTINIVSWNILLKGLLKVGHFDLARCVFDGMPERDVVSWNSMISGFDSCGCSCYALDVFREMQNQGVRANDHTYSILTSIVSTARHGKELHGSIVRSGLSISNVVIGNSLIDMYGNLGLSDHSFAVFLTMGELDVISWNSLITVCSQSGHYHLVLYLFCVMRSSGYSPDVFTCSSVIASCSYLQNLDKGKQIFTFCVKVGFLCNTIVSSAAIDLFSKCNRLEDSVRLFEELDQWDSAVCNSMISSFAWNGFSDDAFQLLLVMLRDDIRPTEFTLSCILSSLSLLPVERGGQVHALVVKSGLELDGIVASTLVEMYSKFGFVDIGLEIFNKMVQRDLISWNTMIMGFTDNGRVVETLETFSELLKKGPPPDRITLFGVLLACQYGGLVDDALMIFSEMEGSYGIKPSKEHYSCIIELLCRAGRLYEAVDIVEAMHCEPSSSILQSILYACAIQGDFRLAERTAKTLMELEPQSSLSYLILARMYEIRGQWGDVIRVKKSMERKRIKKVIGCSWIGIRNHVYSFEANQLQHHGGKDIYLVLRLLNWEMEDEIDVCL